ncbi:MAG: hypothetical protein IJ876_03000 [Elusimicrobiaceae bacterium]|nr:hypothetical protein [Elusimicrobiaceae bacterium]
MKQRIVSIILLTLILIPGVTRAQNAPEADTSRLSVALALQTAQGVENYLSAPDAYGTPLIIKLARQGDVKTLLSLAEYSKDGQFLLSTDKYGNNLFHAAKNADTVQAAASLIRRFYGAKAPRKISELVDARNTLDETPLHAQINAAHTDTFRPIYAYTSLKKKNDSAHNQLARLRGSDERIYAQHKAIYCQHIIEAGSAHGITLWQAAQTQTQYNPSMSQIAYSIGRVLPCLVN